MEFIPSIGALFRPLARLFPDALLG